LQQNRIEEKRREEKRRGEKEIGGLGFVYFAAGEKRRKENREELDESGGTTTQVSFRRFLELVGERTSVQ
jgi:hypothetical protein